MLKMAKIRLAHVFVLACVIIEGASRCDALENYETCVAAPVQFESVPSPRAQTEHLLLATRALLSTRDYDHVNIQNELSGRRRRRRRRFFGRRRRRIGKSINKIVKKIGKDVSNAAKTVGNRAVKVGKIVVTGAKDLGNAIERLVTSLAGNAKRAVAESKKLVGQIAKQIGDRVEDFGEDIRKIGVIAAGFAKDAWEAIKDFFQCFAQQRLLCSLLLPGCDCDAGSSVNIDFKAVSLKAKCVAPTGDFAKNFRLAPWKGASFGKADKSSGNKVKLPGVEKTGVKKGPFKTRKEAAMNQANAGLKDKLSKAPSGSCDGDLSLALDGEAEFEPVIELEVSKAGDTKVVILATASLSLSALVEAEGACKFSAERRFPKVPKTKVACAGPFCIAIMLQAVVQIDINGQVTGDIAASVGADFGIRVEVAINIAKGTADSTVKATEFNHQEGLSFAAAMDGSIDIGLGPHLVIWPMPGVPVDVLPMLHAEVKAVGELAWTPTSSSSLIQSETCAAASLNVFGDSDVSSFSLPESLMAGLSTSWLQEAVEQAIVEGATALLKVVLGPAQCIPGGGQVRGAVMGAAGRVGSTLASAIPSLNIELPASLSSALFDNELFCKELLQIGSDCNDAVGCGSE